MTLKELKAELKTAQEELNNASVPHISYEDIEDVSDAYQERLEFDWWLDDQKELIKNLETKILLLS